MSPIDVPLVSSKGEFGNSRNTVTRALLIRVEYSNIMQIANKESLSQKSREEKLNLH